MNCADFLQLYSDYRDGRLANAAVRHSLERHIGACVRCARYHHAVSRGVDWLRSLGGIEPSAGFQQMLRRRLAGPNTGAPVPMPQTAAVVAALLLAASTTLFVLEGLTRHLASGAAHGREIPVIVANPGVPFVGFTTGSGRARSRAAPPPLDEHPAESLARWTTAP